MTSHCTPWTCWCGARFLTGWNGARALHHKLWHKEHGDGQWLVGGSKQPESRPWACMRRLAGFRDKWTCQHCNRRRAEKSDLDIEVHHIIAKLQGGTDHMTNLITLCTECHGRTLGGSYSGNPAANRKLGEFEEVEG